MKITGKIIIACVCLIFCASGLVAQKKIAIITYQGNASLSAKKMVYDEVNNIVKDRYSVVDNPEITDSFDESQILEAVKETEANVLLLSTVNAVDENYEMIFKMIDISTNIAKPYQASTTQGFVDFDDVLNNVMKSVLSDVQKTGKNTSTDTQKTSKTTSVERKVEQTASRQTLQNNKVAIFEPSGSVDASVKEIAREEISSVIANIKKYAVLDQQFVNRVLEENNFQPDGLATDSKISEIAKQMGANYVFVASINPLETNYYISCKMIDVQTVRIEKKQSAQTSKGSSDFIETIQKLVTGMLGQQSNATVTASQNLDDDEDDDEDDDDETDENVSSQRSKNKKITVTFGSLDFMKKQKVIQFTYTYKNMMVGEMTETEYVGKKVSDYNQKDAGKGDRWKEAWVKDRKERFVPK
ncbi:MAG: hypothetical protein LBT50_06605, partial [Prevotellaceae bacterium]|nr:hypothetical protein [Prevotellaceae bacterium]